MEDKKLFSGLRARLRQNRTLRNSLRDWAASGYAPPSPPHIKRAVLMRLGLRDATWIETGTFMGDTTAMLAQGAKRVYTIEPDKALFEKASNRFRQVNNVEVIHGLSEDVLPTVLPRVHGDTCFWLDGHYSGGITHQGPTDCPVREELRQIEMNASHFDRLVVLIDDVRCFDPTVVDYLDYPSLDFLVDWSRANGLKWHIEHDIFVARSK